MGQDPLLFPHLSALENVAFGPRSQGRPKAVASAAAGEWLDRMGLSGFASRRPPRCPAVSGNGWRWPVPWRPNRTSCCWTSRSGRSTRRRSRRSGRYCGPTCWRPGTTSLMVTHDVLDAAVLADRVIVIERG